MSGEVNMIQTLRKFRGGPDQANLGGASLETFSGEAQLKKSPCINTKLDQALPSHFDVNTPVSKIRREYLEIHIYVSEIQKNY